MSSEVISSESDYIDPVCGMPAGEEGPTHKHEGETYHFCSELCRHRFRSNPAIYLDESTSEDYSYARTFRDFWMTIAFAIVSNAVGLVFLYIYISLVFGTYQVDTYAREQAPTPLTISILSGMILIYWLLNPLIRHYSYFWKETEHVQSDDTLRQNALNAPIFLGTITLAIWMLMGSLGSILFAGTGVTNYWRWLFHVWGANFFTGLLVALGVFYISERVLMRRVIPRLMGGEQVSDLEGVIPVPVWFRISMLILTAAILPMIHVFGLNWLGDTDSNLILFFIVLIIATAIFQAFYILRSISLPIGRIADQFERFQEGETLLEHQRIYRADDLGRFAEMFENLVGTIQERDFLRMTFGRYMSQQVMEQIINGQVELGGEKHHATVLFTDVRDFTSLTEKRDPEEVVRLLNDYFERMVQAIIDTDGIPDKFIGDGIMAVWGVPIEVENHPERAVEGAFEMFDQLERFNQERLNRGEEPLKIGTAIHCGELIAGNIGSNEKMEFTVIGDTVNTCSRIESMNKKFNTRLTISETVYELLSPDYASRFSRKPDVEIRGKSDPITVYTLEESNEYVPD